MTLDPFCYSHPCLHATLSYNFLFLCSPSVFGVRVLLTLYIDCTAFSIFLCWGTLGVSGDCLFLEGLLALTSDIPLGLVICRAVILNQG